MSPLKPTLLGAGRQALHLAKLLVLAYWIGGGLVAGVIAPVYLHRSLDASKQEEATRLSSGIFFWFSIGEIALGGLLFAALFFAERERKRSLATLAGLVLITCVNQFLAYFMQHYEAATSTYSTLHSVSLALFFFAMAAAAAFFAVIVLEGRRAAPVAAAPE